MKIPGAAKLTQRLYTQNHPALERELFGLKFPNPVGLAAGLDKDAVLVDELANLGFGFLEIGTLTPRPQPGNPQPRLFRLPKDRALINRMGFNNGGVREAVIRLKARRSNIILGGNIGKNKDTPNDEAANDYLSAFKELYPVVDYFVVNVSSPNTPNLRELQDKEPLKKLLSSIQELNNSMNKRRPLLLKIAPDLSEHQLDDIIALAFETELDGLIATNTTIDRSNLSTPEVEVGKIGAGGLSGRPLERRSTEVIRFLHKALGPKVPIVGVGGIMSATDALEKLEAGASLLQLYTGFVYRGPALIKEINQAIIDVELNKVGG
jgi:dihydroorotate dehydrogenase